MNDQTMQAVMFDRPASDTTSTRVASVPVPEPGPGQVAIDVHYAGVNFKDVMIRRGDPGYTEAWPFVPGLEVAGTVRAVGPGVPGPTVGERVAAYTVAGGLAEVALAQADLAVRVPAGLDLERAAAAPAALVTAALLLDDIGRLRPGDRVLVHSAAGGVGQALARLARLGGASLLLGTVGHRDRVAAAEQAGYDRALVRGGDLAATIREVTDGLGVDLVLDPQGTAQLDLDLAVLAPAGRIVIFGNAGGAAMAALPPVGQLFAANAAIAGFSLTALVGQAPSVVAAALARVLDHLASGALDVDITRVEGLPAVAAAQQALAEGRGSGKHIVRVAAAGAEASAA